MPTIFMEQGIPKDSSGAIMRGSGAIATFSNGYPLDSTGALLFGTTLAGNMQGLPRDSLGRIVENKGGVIAGFDGGLPVDSSGKLVTVAKASAAAPITHLNGMSIQLDANKRIVVST